MTVMVDGEYLSVDVVNLVAQSVVLADGTTVAPATSYEGNSPAKVSLKVTANQDLASNFVDASAETTASTVVVSAFVQDYYYDEEGIPATGLKFETAKGESFDPDLFTAVFGGKNIPIDVTVTKDGETVTDYSEPGTYNAVITCAVPDDLSYAGTHLRQGHRHLPPLLRAAQGLRRHRRQGRRRRRGRVHRRSDRARGRRQG